MTVDGKTYSSFEKYVPAHIYELMTRIRREGNSEEVVSRWKNEYNIKEACRKFRTENEVDRLKTTAKLRLLYMCLTLPFIIVIFMVNPHGMIMSLLLAATAVLAISLLRGWIRH